MPREDVPYPDRGNCSLKCKLKEIWNALQGKLHSVNGLTGNGAENVNIVSTTPEVLQVNNNASLQQVELSIDLQNPTISGDLTVDGDLIANGDIIQNGSAYETHAQKVYTTDDYIVTRDGAVGPLAAGDYSGFEITKYDGTNNGRLVVDRDGTARVGDVGDEQALATRDESADLTDGDLVKWDGTNLKLIDAGVKPEDLGLELYDEFSVEGENLGAGETQSITVTLSATKTFTAGYDYFIYAQSPAAYANITSDDVEVATNTATFNVIYQPQDSSIPELIFRIYRMKNAAAPRVGYVRVNFVGTPSVMDQPKLVSGTNIKTVGGQSILGSGDIPAGGLTWTERTANNDWTDMFEYVGSHLITKKHIFITASNLMQYLPKGYDNGYNTINIPWRQLNTSGTDSISTMIELQIPYNKISSSSSTVKIFRHLYTFTTDGTTITITRTTSSNDTSKSQFKIWVAD